MRTWMWLLLFLGSVLAVLPEQAQAQHFNKLNWGQGNCTGCTITSNNVYRSKTTGAGYTKIFSSTAPILTYTDSAVVAGDVNFYVITAVCAACTTTESPFSNELKSTTPADTQSGAPQNLTGVSQ